MTGCVDIVIVNWNAGRHLPDLMSSMVAHHHGVLGKVVVVDNASSDGSVEWLKGMSVSWPFRIEIIRNDRNIGFGAACNQGAKHCESELILFLNPDTKLFETSLSVPVAFLNHIDNAEVGIVGIQLVDETGAVSRTCARFPSLRSFFAQAFGVTRLRRFRKLSQTMVEWGHMESRKVDQVMGAFFLLRKELFESLGGFDERFFVYFEEVDFSLRAREAGWVSVYISEAQAFHEGGGTSRQVKPRRLFYSLRSRVLYGFKHFRWLHAWLLVCLTLVIEPMSRSIFCLVTRAGLVDTWRGYLLLYREMPSILRRSRWK